MMYELDLSGAALSYERLREVFTIQPGFDEDPDLMDIYTQPSENRSTLIGNLNFENRWVSIDGHFILQFLSKFTPTELSKIIPLLKFSEVDGTR